MPPRTLFLVLRLSSPISKSALNGATYLRPGRYVRYVPKPFRALGEGTYLRRPYPRVSRKPVTRAYSREREKSPLGVLSPYLYLVRTSLRTYASLVPTVVPTLTPVDWPLALTRFLLTDPANQLQQHTQLLPHGTYNLFPGSSEEPWNS